MSPRGGRHHLQVPGPTNVPDRVLSALARPTLDHRGPVFAEVTRRVLRQLSEVFQTASPVVVYPSSGTGAWEAALVNTVSPGDRVLAVETGHFAVLWSDLARRLGLVVDLLPGDWRTGVDPDRLHARLSADTRHEIAAVMVVHNETSTGVRSRLPQIRAAIDEAAHPALLLVDVVSSIGSIDYRHDEWRVDVAVGASQKGLMLPPGLGFNALSDRALAARASARLPRAYWDWDPILTANADGFFPYTPASNLLVGLGESLRMIDDEGLRQVFDRHDRLATATRAAARAWGVELVCRDDREYSSSTTALLAPDGVDSGRVVSTMRDRFDVSLGIGLGKLSGRAFRIGHLGHLNDVSLLGVLAGLEAGLPSAGIPVASSGIEAAIDVVQRWNERGDAPPIRPPGVNRPG